MVSENSNNINVAAGLIAASWQSSQTQSVVDGYEYREERERKREEKKISRSEGEKKGMKCNASSALIFLQL